MAEVVPIIFTALSVVRALMSFIDDVNKAKYITCRQFKFTVISASNLPDVRALFRNRIYAIISIGDDEETEYRTPPDYENGLNPYWDYTIQYNLEETSIRQGSQPVVVKLYSERTFGDRGIGELRLELDKMFDRRSRFGRKKTLEVELVDGEEFCGVLKLSYSFGKQFFVKRPHVSSDELSRAVAKGLLKLSLRVVKGVITGL